MKNQQRHSGQSLVEFALIFPLIFFLTVSFLDLGRAVFYYSSLTNAVREATRYAIVHKDEIIAAYNSPTNNSLQDKVLEYAFGLSDISDPLTKEDIVIIIPEKVNDNFTTVSIKAVYTFKPITPGMKELFGSSEGIDLTAQSKMLISPGSR
jgi:Flp pilus assembly protein TadG